MPLSSQEKYFKRREAYWKGRRAEKWASWYLRLKGYRLLKERLKTPFGEIDLLMKRGDTLVVVEVKARPTLVLGLEALSARSQERLKKALQFALTHRLQYDCYNVRFDLIVMRPWRLPFHLPHILH